MKMKKIYDNMEDFINDVHNLSLKDTIMEMGMVLEEDFRGSKICCPFHDEKTPSMQITDNFFKCYGCNAKGDLIKWIELYNNLTFFESIKYIAEHFDCEIKNTNILNYNNKQKELNTQWEIYKKDFIEKIKQNNNDSIKLKNLSKRFFPQEVGYDKNINYMVLPFTSKTGNVLGFTKRRIDTGDSEKDKLIGPKWKHSNMEDSLIKNCHNIFNLYGAFNNIRKNLSVVIVEGPADVASCQRSGILNVISISGTSNFSNDILDVLKPLKQIILMMDGDDPGLNATKKNLKTLMKISSILFKDSFVVNMPKDKDPGDLNKEELLNNLDNKEPSIKWFIENCSDDEIKELYNECDSKIVIPLIITELMKKYNFNYEQAMEFFENQKQFNNNEEDFKNRLLATIGKLNDINVDKINISEEKAKRILKLRFNLNF